MLIIHGDTNGHRWSLFTHIVASLVYLAEQACLLDLTMSSVRTETSATNLRVELTLRQHKSLIASACALFPLKLTKSLSRQCRLTIRILRVGFDAWLKFDSGIARQPIARMVHILFKERYFDRLIS